MTGVDTNILLYAYDRRDPVRQQIAVRLISELQGGVLLWQVACEFLAASRKLSGQGFTQADAATHLDDLRRVMPLVVPSAAVLDRAAAIIRDRQVHV